MITDGMPTVLVRYVRKYSDLYLLRKNLGLSQMAMANHMGVTINTYCRVETGRTKLTKTYALAAERVALEWAAAYSDPTLAPLNVLQDAAALAKALDEMVEDL